MVSTHPIEVPWSTTTVPEALLQIPAMLSREEVAYLIWLTEQRYEGWGEIVDLGPWLGASSASLAEGLKRAGRSATVKSLDLFSWEPSYMERPGITASLSRGQDFMPEMQRLTAPWSAWIKPERADLRAYRWTGGPIEILFVDAAKTWELTSAIFRNFAAAIVPGRTRVIYQDFRFALCHWLPLITDSRPDIWEEIEAVGMGTTVTFRVLRPLFSPGGIARQIDETHFPYPSAERLLRLRAERGDHRVRCLTLQTLYRKALLSGTVEDAARVRGELEALGDFPPDAMDLPRLDDVGDIFLTRGWERYNAGDFAGAEAIARRGLGCGTDDRESRGLLVCSLTRQGRLSEADRLVPGLFTDQPGAARPSYRLHLADLRIAQGRLQEAGNECLAVIPELSQDVEIEYCLSLLWKVAHQSGEPRPILQSLEALARTPLGTRRMFLEWAVRLCELADERTLAAECQHRIRLLEVAANPG